MVWQALGGADGAIMVSHRLPQGRRGGALRHQRGIFYKRKL